MEQDKWKSTNYIVMLCDIKMRNGLQLCQELEVLTTVFAYQFFPTINWLFCPQPLYGVHCHLHPEWPNPVESKGVKTLFNGRGAQLRIQEILSPCTHEILKR